MLNFPNILSIARIILILPFILLLTTQHYGWALGVFIAAALTDAIDGILARLLHQGTVLGSILDPAADKLLMAVSFIALAVLALLPAWLAVLVIVRDVIIVLGLVILRLSSRPQEIRPTLASKMTTLFQLGTIGATCLQPLVPVPLLYYSFIAGTAITTVISGLQYIGKGFKILKREKI